MSELRIAAHIGYLFTELPLVDRFSAARDAGFEAVDLSDIARHPLDDILIGMRRSGLGLLQTTAVAGSRDRSEPGIAALPGREQEFRAACRTALPLIVATGARFVHFTSGIPGPDATFEQCYATYLGNLRFALDLLVDHKVTVLIETINGTDLPGYFLQTLALAQQVIAEIGQENLKLLFDVYHVAMSGLDPVRAFQETLADIGHAQLADHPGRHEPGTGTIDFAALMDTAAKADYQGWFSAEYMPLGTTKAGLDWLAVLRTGRVRQISDGHRNSCAP